MAGSGSPRPETDAASANGARPSTATTSAMPRAVAVWAASRSATSAANAAGAGKAGS